MPILPSTSAMSADYPAPPPRTEGVSYVLFAVLFVIFATRHFAFARAKLFTVPPVFDAEYYLAIAAKFSAAILHGSLRDLLAVEQVRAPLAPLLTAIVSVGTGSFGREAAFSANLIVAAAGFAAFLVILHRRTGHMPLALTGTLMLASSAGLLGALHDFKAELPVTMMAIIFLATFQLLRARPTRPRTLANGVALALMLLSKTMIVPIATLFYAITLVEAPRASRRSIVNGALIGLVLAGVWYAPHIRSITGYLTNAGFGAVSTGYDFIHGIGKFAFYPLMLISALSFFLALPMTIFGIAAAVRTRPRLIAAVRDPVILFTLAALVLMTISRNTNAEYALILLPGVIYGFIVLLAGTAWLKYLALPVFLFLSLINQAASMGELLSMPKTIGTWPLYVFNQRGYPDPVEFPRSAAIFGMPESRIEFFSYCITNIREHHGDWRLGEITAALGDAKSVLIPFYHPVINQYQLIYQSYRRFGRIPAINQGFDWYGTGAVPPLGRYDAVILTDGYAGDPTVPANLAYSFARYRELLAHDFLLAKVAVLPDGASIYLATRIQKN